ncbi:hypothetical protein PMI15_04053 [Polaromonas sp. CF318]|uniref:hypothetical protein n=1 Tax=Polaromonas sp. CF318 TaxID=1144318 RepID=UPI0002713D6E|nr:hypothetical protein [Polaromonas sp. CF318]EJL79065.1 hypothetical protein PMI15_04053 [Polaromonas sp. CF318]
MEFSDYDLGDMLEELVEGGYIARNSAAHGVALLYLDKGLNALTDKQKAVYTRLVEPHMRDAATKREIDDVLARNPK